FVEARGGVGFAVAAVGVARLLAAGHPGFDVHHRRVLYAEVAGAALDHAVRELEALQNFLGVAEHFLVPALRLLDVAAADDDLLDFVELVYAINPGGVLAVGARFATETRADGGV